MYTRQVVYQAGAYPGFSGMKGPGVFLLPPGWDVSPSRGYPSIKFASTHLPGGERHCESKVFCPRTQHNSPCKDSNQDRSFRSRAH